MTADKSRTGALTDHLHILSVNEEAMEEAIERFDGSSTGEALKCVLHAQKQLRALLVTSVEQHEAAPAEELREAARQFHNLTQGDSTVIIRAPSAAKRDAIVAAGERLRAALLSSKAAPLEGTGNGAMTEDLNRSIEQWRKCDPDLMSRQSQAAIFYALKDAQHDILTLAALVESSKRSES